MKLENMIPQDVTFEANGKEYTFRPMNLGDKVWLKKEYGDNLVKLLSAGDLAIFSRIGYRLLREKSAYKPVNVTEIDESGVVHNISVGGLALFCDEFKGNTEIIKLLENVGKAMAAGEPVEENGENVDKIEPSSGDSEGPL